MESRRIVALIVGCLLVLPGVGLLLGGGAVAVIELAARDSGGWHSMTIDRLESAGVAVTTRETMVRVEGPAAVISWLDLQARVSATAIGPARDVFVGVGPSNAVSAYFDGAARTEVTAVNAHGIPSYRSVSGTGAVSRPAEQGFWVASASGPGAQQVTWSADAGDWTLVVLNADGSPGVAVSADVGVRAGALLPIGVGLSIVGLILLIVGAWLVATGARTRDAGSGSEPSGIQPLFGEPATSPTERVHPLVLEARLAPELSRWLWLVKWLLVIPHIVVLAFLWVAFAVTTVIAWFAILFTGSYPRGLFDFNVGVLRWTWRVGYYAGSGGLGSDRYPPFTLEALPDDDARLDVAYPPRLSRWLVLVKWLLLVPQWIVVAVLAGTQSRTDDNGVSVGGWPGVIALLVFVAALALLFGGEYPRGLFDVVIGLNRWVFRVIVYAALMTDVYPPFRYDGGGSEPGPPTDGPHLAGPATDALPPPTPTGSGPRSQS